MMRTSRILHFAVWLLLSGCWLMPAAGWAQPITANDFRNSQFRGFTIGGADYRGVSTDDLNALAKTGANLVRIFITLKRCPNCVAYEDLQQQDLSRLDALIDRLGARSIYVVLVLRPMGDERGPFWDSTLLKESFVQQWKTLTTRYRSVANMAGFDLLNEPVPPGRTYADRQSTWAAYAEALGREIRALDPMRVLIVESAPDSTPTSFENVKPLSLENVVYSFHSYLPIALTHQGVMKEYSKPMTYGLGGASDANRQDLHKFLNVVANFSAKHNVPILVGEFSCVRWAPQGSAYRYLSDSIEFFEAKGWSWIYHEFRAWPGWDAEVASEAKAEAKRSFEAPLMKLLREKMASNKK